MTTYKPRIDNRPEPVTSLIDLNATYSLISLIEGMATIAEYDAEQNSCRLECGNEKAGGKSGFVAMII